MKTVPQAPNAEGGLVLTCYKCTRQAMFTAATKQAAVERAKEHGWLMDDLATEGEPPDYRPVCPECPAFRAEKPKAIADAVDARAS